MRARTLGLSALASVVVLGGAWEMGRLATPAASGPVSSAPAAPASSGEPKADDSATATPGGNGSTSRATAKGSSGTFAGATDQTPYGPVQVAVVVRNGRVTDVKALQLTNDSPRSTSISDGAAPVLRQEALKAQSAKIDTVSGASYTSDGYRSSLQSALDKAGL